MKNSLLSELLALPAAQRLNLVHDLWDSVDPDHPLDLSEKLSSLGKDERIQFAMELWNSLAPEDHPPLTPEQIAEAERRYAEHLRDPSSALPWEEVRKRLWSRYA